MEEEKHRTNVSTLMSPLFFKLFELKADHKMGKITMSRGLQRVSKFLQTKGNQFANFHRMFLCLKLISKANQYNGKAVGWEVKAEFMNKEHKL